LRKPSEGTGIRTVAAGKRQNVLREFDTTGALNGHDASVVVAAGSAAAIAGAAAGILIRLAQLRTAAKRAVSGGYVAFVVASYPHVVFLDV
jgi:hypothetical protein